MKLHNLVSDVHPVKPWYYADEVTAHMAKLKAVVEGMGHFSMCDTWNPGINGGCNCPRGEALRLIGEVLG